MQLVLVYRIDSMRLHIADDSRQDETVAATTVLSLAVESLHKTINIVAPQFHKTRYTIKNEHSARTTFTMIIHNIPKRMIVAHN